MSLDMVVREDARLGEVSSRNASCGMEGVVRDHLPGYPKDW